MQEYIFDLDKKTTRNGWQESSLAIFMIILFRNFMNIKQSLDRGHVTEYSETREMLLRVF